MKPRESGRRKREDFFEFFCHEKNTKLKYLIEQTLLFSFSTIIKYDRFWASKHNSGPFFLIGSNKIGPNPTKHTLSN